MAQVFFPAIAPLEDGGDDAPPDDGWFNPLHQTPRDSIQQFIISLFIGLSAFITFCVIRPRWPQFYYARKTQIRNAAALPDMPKSFFGWMTTLWKITDQEVLATAGLDAYVFLAFFKMAIKFLLTASVLAGVVLLPIHMRFGDQDLDPDTKNPGSHNPSEMLDRDRRPKQRTCKGIFSGDSLMEDPTDESYLWAHLVFVYVFTGLAYYFLLDQTQDVVHVRQEYLGKQSTVTDRTVKLSGIPEELRSEGTLKEYIEGLRIGKVESITICRDWSSLDKLMEKRKDILRKLEEAHTVYLKKTRAIGGVETAAMLQQEPSDGDEEYNALLDREASVYQSSARPTLTLRRNWFDIRGRKADAIYYLTAQLQTLDDKITKARRQEYTATPLAFVTMDSVPAAEVAVQALLDPMPGALIARHAPSPRDIIWSNTYLSRTSRSFRGWTISIFVTLLSIFWLIPVAALAVLWNLSEIRKIAPSFADLLERNEILSSLVQTFLPTVVLTLLNVAIPYLYDWLSQYQGLLSNADVELSVISKNFFFTFFNLFLAFTISGTAFTFRSIWDALRDSVKDTRTIACLLATAVQNLLPFYINLIILQGLAIFPMRLLQIGSLSLYPITKYGAKTPRDYSELLQPAEFRYGFFLPQPILIFIICLVYSVLSGGFQILAFGLVYFVCGYFTYKYQLLYAMNHPRHSTGRAWPMIVYRVILGIIVFQLTMTGWLALRQAYTRATLIVPLLAFSCWTIWHYRKQYLPSNLHIALKSVRGQPTTPPAYAGMHQTLDEASEEGLQFINPSLISPLESPWVTEPIGEDHVENGANGVNGMDGVEA